MKRCLSFLLAALSLAISTQAAETPPLRHTTMGVANGCFVETVAVLDRWQEKAGADAWVRLLQWGAKADEEVVVGHAVAVGESSGALWCWDVNFGWTKLPVEPAHRDDAERVAAPVVAKYPRLTVRYPLFRFDFPQPPAQPVPTARRSETNSSWRDASIVGERLGGRRPINVVKFSYGTGDERKETAAAVFVFHGRYCVYVPEAGTVPFRVRGSVENLRLVQELLRRMFPGVGTVTKLEE